MRPIARQGLVMILTTLEGAILRRMLTSVINASSVISRNFFKVIGLLKGNQPLVKTNRSVKHKG